MRSSFCHEVREDLDMAAEAAGGAIGSEGRSGRPYRVVSGALVPVLAEEIESLWASLGKAPNAYPTPQQVVAFFRSCSDEAGADLAARLIDASESATRCWLYRHEHEV